MSMFSWIFRFLWYLFLYMLLIVFFSLDNQFRIDLKPTIFNVWLTASILIQPIILKRKWSLNVPRSESAFARMNKVDTNKSVDIRRNMMIEKANYDDDKVNFAVYVVFSFLNVLLGPIILLYRIMQRAFFNK